jgi:hypothetical protein
VGLDSLSRSLPGPAVGIAGAWERKPLSLHHLIGETPDRFWGTLSQKTPWLALEDLWGGDLGNHFSRLLLRF